MQQLEFKIPPPIAATITAVLMWVIANALPIKVSSSVLQLVAGPLALVGAAVSAAGIYEFWRAGTAIDPRKPEKASLLVTTGVFSFSRNPMYVGLLLTLLGWACYLMAPLVFLGPIAFAFFTYRFQVLPEERVLSARFGETYAAYQSRVRRWL